MKGFENPKLDGGRCVCGFFLFAFSVADGFDPQFFRQIAGDNIEGASGIQPDLFLYDPV